MDDSPRRAVVTTLEAAGDVGLDRDAARSYTAARIIDERAGLREVLIAGTETAKAMAAQTLGSVRRLMHT